MWKSFQKYALAEKNSADRERRRQRCRYRFHTFGTVARITREAIDILAGQGLKAGIIRPITLWPFPYRAFDEIGDKTKVVISAELSMGQMLDDVKIGVCGRLPVSLIHRTGGMVPTSIEIAEKARTIYLDALNS